MELNPIGDDKVDVAICGAGAAGMAAAIAAARSGAVSCLLEQQGNTGGTVSQSLIHTLGGIFDDAGEFLQPGLTRELAERLMSANKQVRARKIGKAWTLSVDPEVYTSVTRDWLDEEGVVILLGSHVVDGCIHGSNIDSLTIRQDPRGGIIQMTCSAVIDCTGGAEVVRVSAPDKVHDESLLAAAGLIFQLHEVERAAISFPRNIEVLRGLRRAVEQGALPAVCEKIWIDLGSGADDAYVKLFIPLNAQWREPREWSRIEEHALHLRDQVFQWLSKFRGFEKVRLGKTGRIGIRDCGRIEGDYVLNEADVRGARKFSHPACRCQWPIEYWHPEHGVTVEYLSPGSFYEIPLEALKVRGMTNLWAAGKCVSAEPLARASARVVGCCWGMGEAVGIEAAKYSRMRKHESDRTFRTNSTTPAA